MPFGLKMLQDVFQIRIDNITERLKGIISIHDDICVFGRTQQEHDENLLQLMKIAQKHGLVFNSNKCQISKQEITFYGANFSVKGMKPDPKKVQALQDLPIPQTQKRATVIPRSHQLPSTILTRPFSQDHLSQRTSQQMGLDTIYRHSISPPQTMDMQYTTKNNISLL